MKKDRTNMEPSCRTPRENVPVSRRGKRLRRRDLRHLKTEDERFQMAPVSYSETFTMSR